MTLVTALLLCLAVIGWSLSFTCTVGATELPKKTRLQILEETLKGCGVANVSPRARELRKKLLSRDPAVHASATLQREFEALLAICRQQKEFTDLLTLCPKVRSFVDEIQIHKDLLERVPDTPKWGELQDRISDNMKDCRDEIGSSRTSRS